MAKTLTKDWQLIGSRTPYTGFTIGLYAKYSSQSVSSNSTNVDVEERITTAKETIVNCYTHSCNFTGGTFTKSDSKGSYYHGWGSSSKATTTTILSESKTIEHDADGDKSFTLGAYFTCSAGISGTISTETINLPKINRLSVFSVDKANFDIGDILNVSITKYVDSYTSDLYMVIGSNEVLLESNVGSSVQVETSLLANQIYQQIPNDKTYSNVFKLYTYDGSTSLGSNSVNYTATASNSNPSFNLAYQDTNQTTTGITQDNQKIIQNKSTLQVNITGASVTHYAGSLTSASVTINNQVITIPLSGTTNVSADINIGTLNLSQNTNAIVRVTDSRGNYLEKTITILVLPYESPSAIVTLKRKLNYYTQTDINVDANYSSLDGNNTINITYRIKKTTDATWGSYASLQDNVTTTFNADNLYAWNVEVLLQDALETRVLPVMSLGTGQPPLYVDVMNNSVGVNCFPSARETLEVNGDIVINKQGNSLNVETKINELEQDIEDAGLDIYSTTEKIIGTWIDGKPIYRQVQSFGTITGQTNGTAITGLSQLVRLYGVAYSSQFTQWYNIPNTHSNISQYYINVLLTGSNHTPQVRIGSSLTSLSNVYVIIEYTKSS